MHVLEVLALLQSLWWHSSHSLVQHICNFKKVLEIWLLSVKASPGLQLPETRPVYRPGESYSEALWCRPCRIPGCRKSLRPRPACSFDFLDSRNLPNSFCICQTPAETIKFYKTPEQRSQTSACFSSNSAIRSCKAFSASDTSGFSSSAFDASSSFLLEKKLRWASR